MPTKLVVHFVVNTVSRRAACGVKHLGTSTMDISKVTCAECLKVHKEWNTSVSKPIEEWVHEKG